LGPSVSSLRVVPVACTDGERPTVREGEPMSTLDSLYLALIELDEPLTLRLAHEAVERGETAPRMILSTCQQALRMVGERYERKEYFLGALVMAGELFNEVLEVVQPLQELSESDGSKGTILLGTVSGDIHDIGKNVFGTALRSYGFKVIDLGVDVPKERFLAEVRQSRPDVVCLSGLIFAAYESMKTTTRVIRARSADLGYRPPVVLGGGTIDSDICDFVGADSWSTDAMEGVRICQRLIGGESDAGSP
jgi:dimethylamine corrinoid protein